MNRRSGSGASRSAMCLGLGVAAIAVLSWAPRLDAQYTLTVAGGAGVEGASATVPILLDNAGIDLRGWSYGVCHDVAELSLTSAASGSTTATVNLGGPPDFESLDLFPGGATHGVVVCFTSCAALTPGTGYELLTLDYSLDGAPGSTTVCFCETLGTPPVGVVVVDAFSAPVTPTQVCGDVQILENVDPVTGLLCDQAPEPCSCLFDLSWANQGIYDTIEIYEDGTLIQTLGGAATSTQVEVASGSAEYCVQPIRDGIIGPATCCQVTCAIGDVFPDPVIISGCVVDQPSCTATITWTNARTYASLEVSVDGVAVQSLPGDATEAVVPLGGPGAFEVCVDGVTICDDAIPAACCTVECLRPFVRADSNGDGSLDIADPIAQLQLFIGVDVVIDCDDALDSNDDGVVDVADPVFTLNYLFTSGPEPPAPFTACGIDPTDDAIRCDEYALCP